MQNISLFSKKFSDAYFWYKYKIDTDHVQNNADMVAALKRLEVVQLPPVQNFQPVVIRSKISREHVDVPMIIEKSLWDTSECYTRPETISFIKASAPITVPEHLTCAQSMGLLFDQTKNLFSKNHAERAKSLVSYYYGDFDLEAAQIEARNIAHAQEGTPEYQHYTQKKYVGYKAIIRTVLNVIGPNDFHIVLLLNETCIGQELVCAAVTVYKLTSIIPLNKVYEISDDFVIHPGHCAAFWRDVQQQLVYRDGHEVLLREMRGFFSTSRYAGIMTVASVGCIIGVRAVTNGANEARLQAFIIAREAARGLLYGALDLPLKFFEKIAPLISDPENLLRFFV